MMKGLKENIISAISTVCFWEGIGELTDFRIAISPDGDVYCSKPDGDWYDEYQPGEDWKIHDVATEEEAIALADNYE